MVKLSHKHKTLAKMALLLNNNGEIEAIFE